MRTIEEISDSVEEFQRMSAGGGCHGPGLLLPAPPEPDLGLSFPERLRWHLRECWRQKSKEERLAIQLAKQRED